MESGPQHGTVGSRPPQRLRELGRRDVVDGRVGVGGQDHLAAQPQQLARQGQHAQHRICAAVVDKDEAAAERPIGALGQHPVGQLVKIVDAPWPLAEVLSGLPVDLEDLARFVKRNAAAGTPVEDVGSQQALHRRAPLGFFPPIPVRSRPFKAADLPSMGEGSHTCTMDWSLSLGVGSESSSCSRSGNTARATTVSRSFSSLGRRAGIGSSRRTTVAEFRAQASASLVCVPEIEFPECLLAQLEQVGKAQPPVGPWLIPQPLEVAAEPPTERKRPPLGI